MGTQISKYESSKSEKYLNSKSHKFETRQGDIRFFVL
jgi:hypothetical protein